MIEHLSPPQRFLPTEEGLLHRAAEALLQGNRYRMISTAKTVRRHFAELFDTFDITDEQLELVELVEFIEGHFPDEFKKS